jgi:metal-sulfur cluster biosynthetic enzyme
VIIMSSGGLQQTVTEDQVYAALKKCMDPEIPVNVVDLGLISSRLEAARTWTSG